MNALCSPGGRWRSAGAGRCCAPRTISRTSPSGGPNPRIEAFVAGSTPGRRGRGPV